MPESTIKTIFVSGANKGVGLAAVKELAAHEKHLVFLGSRDLGRAKSAVSAIKTAQGSEVVAVQVDVTDDASIDAAVEPVKAELEKRGLPSSLNVLVNNAGINIDYDLIFAKGPEAAIPKTAKEMRAMLLDTYQVNTFGAAALSTAFLSLLRASTPEKGFILNISSNLGSIQNTLVESSHAYKFPQYAYGSSKAATNSLTALFARINKDLHVVALNPGSFATDMTHNFSGLPSIGLAGRVIYSVVEKPGAFKSGTFISPANERGAEGEKLIEWVY